MPKFRLVNIQSNHYLDEEPMEADNLEEAQAIILEGQGLRVEEVE